MSRRSILLAGSCLFLVPGLVLASERSLTTPRPTHSARPLPWPHGGPGSVASCLGRSVRLGELGDPAGVPGARIPGRPDELWNRVTGVGDFNGDGLDDIAIGAPKGGEPVMGHHPGQVAVIFGTPSGLPSPFSLDELDGTAGFVLEGTEFGALTATSIAGLGDVNGDGFADLGVGCLKCGRSGIGSPGLAWIVFGAAGPFPALRSLGTLDGTNGFAVVGSVSGSWTGTVLDGAGDVNGDGFDDVLVTAPYADLHVGRSYVVFGGGGAFPPVVPVEDLDGTNGFRMDGEGSVPYSGVGGGGIGDVNADGLDDIAIGSLYVPSPGHPVRGAAHVVFGTTGAFPAVLSLEDLDGTNGFRVFTPRMEDDAGVAVAGAGDVNADGIADLIVGAPGADRPGRPGSGIAHVLFGRASPFPASFELSAIDGTNGFRVLGRAAHDATGRSVAGVGDVNGDGIDDLHVGADPRGLVPGLSHLVFGPGSPSPASVDLADLDPSVAVQLDGAAIADAAGRGGEAAGDFNGDGFADAMIASNGAISGPLAWAGRAFLVLGCPCSTEDADGDGLSGCEGDADDGDPTTSAAPGATGRMFAASRSRFTLEPATGTGGGTVTHEVLRSMDPASFVTESAATCLTADEGGTSFEDTERPGVGGVFYYVARARQGAGWPGTLGRDSLGRTRPTSDCP